MDSTSPSPHFSDVPDLSWSPDIVEGLRARIPHTQRDEFQPADKPRPPHFTALHRQRLRIQQFQKQWEQIKEDLPPQLSRRHIGMISMGGVIGTGLFVGSADALYHGGPLGALLGYSVIGSAVYCLCVSIGEIIAFLPNVGGVVGLADLYVDRALGFSLGWAAWYNWCITLPAEITAAVNLLQGFQWVRHLKHVGPIGQSAFFLFVATFVNCFSSGFYGEFEYWLSAFKVLVIIATIGACFVINLGAGYSGYIGFKKWEETAPLAQYLDIQGPLGRFLGFWAVLMQASFSFFGSEVPGIAAGEVIDATRNVPRALRRVWIRITMFYVLGIFMVGLVVNANDLDAAGANNSGKISPFWVAFRYACPPQCTGDGCEGQEDMRVPCGWSRLAEALNFAILISAWSAAASDIYIASRFLFFLSCRFHAPRLFATLLRYPSDPSRRNERPQEEIEDVLDQDDDELQQTVQDTHAGRSARPGNSRPLRHTEMPSVSSSRYGLLLSDPAASESGSGSNLSSPDPERSSATSPRRRSWMVLPLYAVLASSSVGLLSFLDYSSAINAFNWLVSVASIASLQSWAGMLFTYIRFYQGTVYAEKKARRDGDGATLENIRVIKENRHRGQPWLAIYAFSICMVVLFTNGWAVFVANPWQIAEIPWQQIDVNMNTNGRVTTPVLQFLASYIPIAFFLLLTFGYKLIHQTKMMSVEEMIFDRGDVPPQEEETEHEGWWNKIIGWALVR